MSIYLVDALSPALYPQGVRRWVPRCFAATLPLSRLRERGAVSRFAVCSCPLSGSLPLAGERSSVSLHEYLG